MIDIISQEEREELLCDSERLKTCNSSKQLAKKDMAVVEDTLDTLLTMFLYENEEIDCDSDIVHFLGNYNQFMKKKISNAISNIINK